MDCREAKPMLSAYLDGELPGADRARVESHLRTCPACSEQLDALKWIDEAAAVPDPGAEYWENFNRRVGERIRREEARPEPVVVPLPRKGWVRRQIRYLVPAAAVAAMVVGIVRQIGVAPDFRPPAPPQTAAHPGSAERRPADAQVPGAPAGGPAPAAPVAAPPSQPGVKAEPPAAPPKGRSPAVPGGSSRIDADEAPGRPAGATAGKMERGTAPDSPAGGADTHRGAASAPPPSAEKKTAGPPPARAEFVARERAGRPEPEKETVERALDGRRSPGMPAEPAPPSFGNTAAARSPEQAATRTEPREGSRSRKDETGRAAVAPANESAGERTAGKSMEDASRPGALPCREARDLAARGLFKEAESAQRACLARDDSPAVQEAGLALLAELLDRQRRFADADAVLEEAGNRFPGSRALELYRRQRAQVQSGRIPFPSPR